MYKIANEYLILIPLIKYLIQYFGSL